MSSWWAGATGGWSSPARRTASLVYFDSDVLRDGDTSVPPSQHTAREELARVHGDGWRAPLEVTRTGALLPEEQRR
ncbi:hypothetical protein BH23CHL1_BH23CHL1_04990 [soil metagenome]